MKVVDGLQANFRIMFLLVRRSMPNVSSALRIKLHEALKNVKMYLSLDVYISKEICVYLWEWLATLGDCTDSKLEVSCRCGFLFHLLATDSFTVGGSKGGSCVNAGS